MSVCALRKLIDWAHRIFLNSTYTHIVKSNLTDRMWASFHLIWCVCVNWIFINELACKHTYTHTQTRIRKRETKRTYAFIWFFHFWKVNVCFLPISSGQKRKVCVIAKRIDRMHRFQVNESSKLFCMFVLWLRQNIL